MELTFLMPIMSRGSVAAKSNFMVRSSCHLKLNLRRSDDTYVELDLI